jgi:hypothetical protein
MNSILTNFIRRVAAGFEANALGPALDTITATGTAIGATLAAATVVVGDSLQVKNQVNNVPAWLLQLWVDNQVAGEVRIRSPKFHDNVDAIRSRVQIGLLDPLLPWGCPQPLFPQDVLTVGNLGLGRRRRYRVDRACRSIIRISPDRAARFADVGSDQAAHPQHRRAAYRDHARIDRRLQRRARAERGHRSAPSQHRLCRARHVDQRRMRGDLSARTRYREPAVLSARRAGTS